VARPDLYRSAIDGWYGDRVLSLRPQGPGLAAEAWRGKHFVMNKAVGGSQSANSESQRSGSLRHMRSWIAITIPRLRKATGAGPGAPATTLRRTTRRRRCAKLRCRVLEILAE